MLSYIIVTRNPSTGKLLVVEDEDEDPAEFATENEAYEVAQMNSCCRSWGAEIVPVDR